MSTGNTDHPADQALANADDWWTSCARSALATAAATRLPFDAYTLTELGVPGPRPPGPVGGPVPHRPRRRPDPCCRLRPIAPPRSQRQPRPAMGRRRRWDRG